MAPADLAAAHAISTSVVVEQHPHQQQSLLPADSNDDAVHTDLQLAGKQQQQQHSPMLATADAAAAAPTPPQQAPLSTDAAEHRHQASQQQREQQDQQQQQSSSEDDSWTPGQPQSSAGDAHAADADLDDDEETWDPSGPPPRYCTNCTARLYQPPTCSDCGHSSEQDDTLFEAVSSVDAVPAAAAAAGRPLIIWDDEMLLHEEGKAVPHPERPDRLRAIMARLVGNGVTDSCTRVPARTATTTELLRVHTADHLQRLRLFCSGTVPATIIPSDTYINQHTLHCAALAAGSAADAAVRVVRGEAACGAAIIRPPGHHAESNTAMGFCFFNNAAVAARAAQAAGAERVLILDWDVHHGNGTQHIFEADPSVLYMSLHRYDRGNFYPGTGAAEEVGRGRGAGFTVNVPWDAANIGNGDYMAAMHDVVLPIAREFAPNLILISAGFDAAEGDPIGGCCLTPECFGNMTAQLMGLAPTVLLLEGGYNLLSTAVSTEACLKVLLGEAPQPLPARPSAFGWLAIQAAKKAHSRYWACLAGAFPQLHAHALAQAQLRLVGSGEGAAAELVYADEYEEEEYEDEDEVEGEDEEGMEEEEAAAADAEMQQRWQQHERLSADGQSRQSAVCGQGASRASAAPTHYAGGHEAAAAAAASNEAPGRAGAVQQLQQHHHQQRRMSRKQQMLRAIHRQAMKSFWRRRLRHSAAAAAAAAAQQQ
uniref:Histone deacetylase domain-containing protein n=1 Tax=Tetradesmus obliquus TaxID=3088 RepID=A0A383V5R9_TETOB|eukprot:jgi/Sobl393_1/17901/SZX60957.1